ncbi:MAG: LysR family transcriptional regulator [Rhodobacterales bacterium]|nr:MAG: LysR family transcriptional regulator [Rhodobacterales bacterium]
MSKGVQISLKQLQAVELVVRHGGYTAGAQALGVSQPTVSNLVLAAESHFSCKLVEKEGARVKGTPLYDAIRGQVVALLALSAEIEDTLAGHRDLKQTTLRLGYTTYQIAIPYVAEFAQIHPGVDLEARAMATHDLLPLIRSGELDLGFVTALECPEGLFGTLVTPNQIGVVLPQSHPLAAKSALNWSDIAGEKLLQREHSSGTRRLFEAAARIAQADVTTILGLGSWGSIAALVRGGAGLGIALEAECGQEPDLLFRPIRDRNLRANHYLVTLPAMKHVAPVRAMFDRVEARKDASASDDFS